MAKKKSISLKSLIAAASVVLGLVTIILLCAPALSPNFQSGESISMAEVAFGNKDKATAFSFLLFLPYILVLVGIALNVLSALNKGGKILPIVAAVCYVAAGVLFFLVMQTYSPYVGDLEGDVRNKAIELARELMADTCTLGVGAILSGIFAFLAGIASTSLIFIKK